VIGHYFRFLPQYSKFTQEGPQLMNFISQNAKVLIGVFIVVANINAAQAAGDADKGKKVFNKCKACHQIGGEAKNSTGPVLTGVVGRKAGTYPKYSYGKSMRKARETGLVWTEGNLDRWLKNPKKYLRKLLDTRKAKAKMKFKLKKQTDRDNVIAYLKTFSAVLKMEVMDTGTSAAPALEKAAMPISVTDICVENQSGKSLLFVVEAKGGDRIVKILNASKNLCAPQATADAGGTVGVFQDADALEGCSRLAKAGTAERLIAFEPFDNCRWAQ
jgi:cytochrome c